MVTHYFFDIVGHGRSELDYTGRILPTPELAYQAAELIAFDIAVKQEDEATGFTVRVSNAHGQELFSIPVQASYLAAA